MFSYYDMVKASTTTTGTGSVTISSAVSPFRSFSVVSDGATIRYLILDANGEWERGYGIYTSSTGILTRNLECSSTGSLIILSGSATVQNVVGSSDLGSGSRLIKFYSITNQASLVISDAFSTAFNDYEIVIKGYTSTNGGSLRASFSTDGGSSYLTGMDYGDLFNTTPSGASGSQSASGSSSMAVFPDVPNTSNFICVSTLRLYDVNGSRFKRCVQTASLPNTTHPCLIFNSACQIRSTSAINAIKLYDPANGSVSWTLSAKVYGLVD